jgi:hypothetical protein
MTKAFHDIGHHPPLKAWLENEEGGPEDADVWGKQQSIYYFSDLMTEKERRGQQNKGKGKAAKKDNQESGESKKKKKNPK